MKRIALKLKDNTWYDLKESNMNNVLYYLNQEGKFLQFTTYTDYEVIIRKKEIDLIYEYEA